MDWLIKQLNRFFDWLVATQVYQPESTPGPQTKKNYVFLMALAIQEFEGWAAPGEKDRSGKVHPNGSASWRRKNPGNIKGVSGKFLTFKTYEEGFTYLEDYIRRAATGKHAAYKPTMSINQFFHVYSPDPEPIPTNYASFVCSQMSLTLKETIYPSRQIRELV